MRHLRVSLSLFTLLLFASTAAVAGGAEVGEPAPGFELVDHEGNTHRLSDYEGKIVVLEWTNPQCPFVKRHYDEETMTGLASQLDSEEAVWLAVDSSHFVTAESASKWAEKEEIPYPILLDPSGEVGRAYGAATTPHMFVIGSDGELLYNGAIDDDPRGKSDSASNYVAAALTEISQGKTVTQAKSKPYGCSVKYQKKAAASSR